MTFKRREEAGVLGETPHWQWAEHANFTQRGVSDLGVWPRTSLLLGSSPNHLVSNSFFHCSVLLGCPQTRRDIYNLYTVFWVDPKVSYHRRQKASDKAPKPPHHLTFQCKGAAVTNSPSGCSNSAPYLCTRAQRACRGNSAQLLQDRSISVIT